VGSSLTSRRLTDDLKHRADHDDLTGLPNRAALTRHLDALLSQPQTGVGRCAVVFVDVDRFKLINDSLGHATGDEVLKAVARRLRGVVRAEDFVARFGGDEFVVVAAGFDDATDVEWLLERVTATPPEPLRVGSRRVFVTLSAGLARWRESDDADTMLRHADAAMYSAKLSPTHRWREYTHALRADAAHRLGLESDLNDAVRDDQIFCEYQPIVDLPTMRPVAHEALARWEHPQLGRIPPDTFIPVVESCGLMPVFTELILERSLRAAVTWPTGTAVSVNLSARHLGDRRLGADILDALRSHGAAPGRLIVEITETAVMEDPETAAANLVEMHDAGVRVAVDDFGTGYTSIDDMRRLPVDLIKIDRSFVAEAATPHGVDMLVALQSLATALGTETIAEGVETVEQLTVLRRLGCRLAQGYLLRRPVPEDLVEHGRLRVDGVDSDDSRGAWVAATLDRRSPA
jgi:diguanylate cyclase (GGDEF)-like protein